MSELACVLLELTIMFSLEIDGFLDEFLVLLLGIFGGFGGIVDQLLQL